MFNTTIHKHESKVVAITKEIEKTISPDKVTEMYDAVKEEVENSIVKAFRVESNQMTGVAVIFNERYTDMTKRFVARYTLNGKEYIVKDYITDHIDTRESEVYEKMYEHYKTQVANELMRNTISLKEFRK
jgi:hypothetical protein